MSIKIAKPIMRYHGAKFRIAPWVMQFFPDHATYIEPFGGAAGVLMQKPRAYAEVYNDLDGDIVNVFRVLQDREKAEKLIRKLMVTPYARDEFLTAYEPTDDIVERARRTIIRASMGFGSAGATKGRTGFRIDSAIKYGTSALLWAEYPDHIAAFVDRLQGVIIENKCAFDVIKNHDREDSLFFVDPPYLPETRYPGRYYHHEMSVDDHVRLLETLKDLRGFVVLSGYSSQLYDDILAGGGWKRHSRVSRISAGRGGAVRNEFVWLNPSCAAALRLPKQQCLLGGAHA